MQRPERESARFFLPWQEQGRRGRAPWTIADAMLFAIGQDDLERQPARLDLAGLPAGDRRRGPAERTSELRPAHAQSLTDRMDDVAPAGIHAAERQQRVCQRRCRAFLRSSPGAPPPRGSKMNAPPPRVEKGTPPPPPPPPLSRRAPRA